MQNNRRGTCRRVCFDFPMFVPSLSWQTMIFTIKLLYHSYYKMGFRSETALEAAIFRTSLAELRYGKGAVASEPIDLRDLQENGTFLSFSQVCPETIVLYYVKTDQKYRFITWFASAAIFQCAGYRSIEKARAGRQHAACAAMCMVKVCTVSAEIFSVSRCQANPAAPPPPPAPAENAFLLDFLSLSRACLGKTIVQYINGSKKAFSAPPPPAVLLEVQVSLSLTPSKTESPHARPGSAGSMTIENPVSVSLCSTVTMGATTMSALLPLPPYTMP